MNDPIPVITVPMNPAVPEPEPPPSITPVFTQLSLDDVLYISTNSEADE